MVIRTYSYRLFIMNTMNVNRVSLKTIAVEAGLSVCTVSEILNNKPNNFSSEITKQKVRKIAEELGYRPNFGYKLMRGEKTKTISILISGDYLKQDEHIQDMIIELISGFELKEHSCYISTFSFDANENRATVCNLIARGVHNFVFLGSPMGYVQIEEEIVKSGKSYVGYNSDFKRTINFDSVSGAEAIFRYFIAEGRNNFRLLSLGNTENYQSDSRFMGLKKVFPDLAEDILIKKYVYPFYEKKNEKEVLNNRELTFNAGYSATAEIFSRNSHIEALFYHSDYFALGGAKFLFEKGIVIGKDILVAGFNNTMAVKAYPFPISSVEHDVKKTSKALIEESFNDQPVKLSIESIVHIRR
jgi:DNA-binding LacI/PurR family transcriptional regulator